MTVTDLDKPMIRVEMPEENWELAIAMMEAHTSAYLARPIVNEIKNQIIRQRY